MVMDWPEPKTVRNLQRFLGLVNYFNRYIECFAMLAAPLYEKTRDQRWKTRIKLSSDELEAFAQLMHALVSPPLLAHPRFDEPFVLQTDGSKVAIGSVLLLVKPDVTERPLAYYSHKLTEPESKYSQKLECHAVYKSVKHFSVYLIAREFTIRTDHKALKWLMKKKPTESIFDRWLAELQCYNFKVKSVKGAMNQAADALSRREDGPLVAALAAVDDDLDFPVDLRVFLRPVVRDLAAVQRSNQMLSKLIEALKAGEKTEDEMELVRYVVEWDFLRLQDAVMVLDKGETRVHVPDDEAIPLTAELHSLVNSSADRILGLA